jgi:hypothetical protein
MLTTIQPRPVCIKCSFALAKPNGKSKLGFQKWHKYCVDCAKIVYSHKHKHLENKKLKCDECNFVPKDKCQLDLVYKDGNKKNKAVKNIITLCANCNRLYQKKNRRGRKSILQVVTVDADIRIS